MIISLIGMSGSGKTFWSKKLANQEFVRFCCDDLIEEKLSGELKKLGYSGINDMSRWMGQPYEDRYQNTSKRYLELEDEVVKEVFFQINQMDLSKNIIIDTTGSVVYTNPGTLKRLSGNSKIVYLKVPQQVEDEMFKLYLLDPKPVIWGESYKKSKGQSDLESLKESYRELLQYRGKKYQKLADITLDYFQLRDKDFTIDRFLDLIK